MTSTQKIVNGTFEDGDFTGWTIKDGDNQPEVVDVFPFLGVYCASLDNNDDDWGGWISQDLSGTTILTDYIVMFRLALHGYSGIEPNVTTLDVTLTYSDLSETLIHLDPSINWVNTNLKPYLIANKTLTDIKIQLVSDTQGMVIHVDEVTLTYEAPSAEGYCTRDMIKERMLIESADDSYNDALDSAAVEASRLIDLYLTPYCVVPLGGDVPAQIEYICADFATSIFKRRMMPDEVKLQGQLQADNLSQMEATGWYAIAKSKLDEYIKVTYNLADKAFTWSSCTDPAIILNALDKRVITVAEARALLKALSISTNTSQNYPAQEDVDAYIAAQIALIDEQIAKMVQDGLLVDATTTKLAVADTDKVVAETAKIAAETLVIPKTGDKLEAEVAVLEAELTRMAADLTKITAENALSSQQVLNLQADVTHLTAVNVNLVSQNTLLTAQATNVGADTTLKGVQSTKLSGADTDILESQIERITAEVEKLSGVDTSKVTQEILNLVAQVTLMGKQGLLVDAQELKTDAETAKITEETEQMPKRGTVFKYCDEDEPEEEEEP